MPQISPPGGHPATPKMAQKRPKYVTTSKIGKIPKSGTAHTKYQKRKTRRRERQTGAHPGRPRNQRESQEKNTNKAARTTRNSDNNDRQEEHGETPTRGRTRPQAEEQRAENREDVDVRYPQATRKSNCVSHQSRITTRVCSTTLVLATPSLSTHIRPCTPEFGPGTSALRSYRVEVGWATAPLFLYRIRADAPNGTRRQCGSRPTVIRQQTDCATGVVASKDFISIAPTKVPALVIASGTFISRLVGVKGTPQHLSPSPEIRMPSFCLIRLVPSGHDPPRPLDHKASFQVMPQTDMSPKRTSLASRDRRT